MASAARRSNERRARRANKRFTPDCPLEQALPYKLRLVSQSRGRAVEMTRAILERKSATGRVLTGVITGLGLAALAYSTALLVINDFGVQWALLSLVTVLLASRLDIGVPRLSGGLALGDVLVFIAMLLFGAHPAVTLAGADAAINSLQHKDRRRVILYNAALKSLAAGVASEVATLIFGDLTRLAGDMFSLGLAVAVIAATHFACNAGLNTLVERFSRRATVWRKSLWW